MKSRFGAAGVLALAAFLGIGTLCPAQDDEDPPKPKKHKPKKADDDPELVEPEGGRLAPEARLCVKMARGDVIKGLAVEPYLDLLQEGNVPEWNKKRKADGGKVLDLAAKMWDAKGRDDLKLALEGLDLRGIDLSNVIFLPGSSFRGSDLSEATFRGACLDGVTFTSLNDFEPRTEQQVHSTSLAKADLRDVVWGWCQALERTCERCADEGVRARESTPDAKRRRQQEEQRRLLEGMRLQQMGTAGGTFAFVDVTGLKLDPDAPMKLAESEDDPAGGARAPSRTLERLVIAAREGTIVRAIDKLVLRRKAARTRECPNPLKAEPALAAAIAAANSSLSGIETWKAVELSDPAGSRGEDATIVGGENVVLVIKDGRLASGAPLLVTRGPVFAGSRAQLPPTFSASAVILKDQARPTGVVHGHPIFALAEHLRGERRNASDTSGTFHSVVVAEVTGVDNLTEQEADRRALQDSKLKDYAATQGDVLEGRTFDPTKEGEALEPEKALPDDVRKAIEAEVGKDAFTEMRCFKLGKQPNQLQHVLSNDPKAILIVSPGYRAHGSIYAEGPVVILGSKEKNERVWVQRCVSKSWVAVRGEPRMGTLLQLGKKVDLETKKEDDDAEAPPQPPKKKPAPGTEPP
jgi:hypothetical protein